MESLLALLTHEYVLTLYGVILWQIEQAFTVKDFTIKYFFRNIGRSLVWVGAVVVFDDELLAQYNLLAHVDYSTPPFWMYIASGFMIDLFRSNFMNRPSQKSD